MAAVEILATYSGGGSGLWEPGVELQDGDALLWFYRADSSAAAPSGRMASLSDAFSVDIDFSYVAHQDWGAYAFSTHYVTSIDGDFTFDGDGETVLVSDTIYAIFDQFTTFTAGNHAIKFALPGVARAHVEAAHLLRGVTPSAPGALLHFNESPYRSVVYNAGGSKTYDAFPSSVPLTGNSSIVYCLWDMSLSVSPPAGYNSVPGTTIKSYTYTDPTDSPTSMTSGKIAYSAGLSGVATSIAAPDEDGSALIGAGTEYDLIVLVINGTEAPPAPVPPTVYFVDLIVFNGSASAAPVEF